MLIVALVIVIACVVCILRAWRIREGAQYGSYSRRYFKGIGAKDKSRLLDLYDHVEHTPERRIARAIKWFLPIFVLTLAGIILWPILSLYDAWTDIPASDLLGRLAVAFKTIGVVVGVAVGVWVLYWLLVLAAQPIKGLVRLYIRPHRPSARIRRVRRK